MTNPLHPDAGKIIKIPRRLLGEAPIYLERMESTGPMRPFHAVFGPEQEEEATRFVEFNNSPDAQRNLYFVANTEFLSGDRRKVNLTNVRFLQVDLWRPSSPTRNLAESRKSSYVASWPVAQHK